MHRELNRNFFFLASFAPIGNIPIGNELCCVVLCWAGLWWCLFIAKSAAVYWQNGGEIKSSTLFFSCPLCNRFNTIHNVCVCARSPTMYRVYILATFSRWFILCLCWRAQKFIKLYQWYRHIQSVWPFFCAMHSLFNHAFFRWHSHSLALWFPCWYHFVRETVC